MSGRTRHMVQFSSVALATRPSLVDLDFAPTRDDPPESQADFESYPVDPAEAHFAQSSARSTSSAYSKS